MQILPFGVLVVMEASSFSHQVVNEQQTKNDHIRELLLQEVEAAKFMHNNNQTMQITMSSFRVNGISYQFHYGESLLLPNSINSINKTNRMFCKETLTSDDMYLEHLYNSEGERAKLLIWECEDADCCELSCCARGAIILHIAIIIILAFAIFILLRYLAKFFCRRIQIVWHQRRKAINKEKVERLKYFGMSYVRSQQEYFNSISSLHQIPNVPAAMPIAVQAGESRPKPPRLYERLFPFLARRRPESQTSLTSSRRIPIYENNDASTNQRVSGSIGSSSQRRFTINVVSPSPDADRNH